MSTIETRSITRELKLHAALLGGFVALLWSIEILDAVVFRGSLDALGIRPRTVPGLVGIALAPLLHGGFAHLAANTLPFVGLGWLIMLRKKRDLLLVTLVAALVGGLGVWLLGAPSSVHIGASGVIFGYFGFLLLRGWFERSALSIALSLVVGLVYGGMIWGVLPTRMGISWEGHLFGFLGGVLAARLLGGRLRAQAARAGARPLAGHRLRG
ncbi:rhomboid family intramembrane serine protease [Sorangium sp. So ce1182]|uniref:rhomboid family intramembrane serine protease n=1 Tax=Sorangium sp. So ce1182 TaxID=3133334 RepID=UPI003F63317F